MRVGLHSECVCVNRVSLNHVTPPLSGFNFTNVLGAAFTLADPKSAKKLINLTVFFALLGSTSAKAASRTLVKLTPGVPENNDNKWSSKVSFLFSRSQFHQHSTSSFYTHKSQKRNKAAYLNCLFCAFGICKCKSCS